MFLVSSCSCLCLIHWSKVGADELTFKIFILDKFACVVATMALDCCNSFPCDIVKKIFFQNFISYRFPTIYVGGLHRHTQGLSAGFTKLIGRVRRASTVCAVLRCIKMHLYCIRYHMLVIILFLRLFAIYIYIYIYVFANIRACAPVCLYTNIYIVYVSGDYSMHMCQIIGY